MKNNHDISGHRSAGPAVLLLAVLCSILLSGCSKLPVYKSYWDEDLQKKEAVYSGYDPDSRIRWVLSNDTENLYLTFDTDNRSSIMSMMSGIKIYIDTNNKKKGNMYLIYPHRTRRERPDNTETRDGTRREQWDDRPGFKSPTEALWVYGGESVKLNFAQEATGFNGFITFDSLGSMYYKVCIPLKAISPGGIKGLHAFSIGVEGEDISGPSSGTGKGMRPGAGNRAGSRMPGGERPGGNPPGNGDFGRGQGPGGGMPSANTIKIWMSTVLAKPNSID